MNRTDLHAENGPIENLQVILLAIACFAFLASIAIGKRSVKLILLFYALLCYSFVLRELVVEEFDIPDALKFVLSGVGHNTIAVAAFIAIFSYAVFHFSYYKKAALDFLISRPGILVMMGGGFLYLSDFFEKHQSIIHHGYFEEIFELCG